MTSSPLVGAEGAAEPGTGSGAPAPSRTARSQAVVTAAVGAAGFIGAWLLYSLLGGGALPTFETVVRLVFSPQLLTWAGAVLVLGVAKRTLSVASAAGWFLLLAPVAAIVGYAVEAPTAFANAASLPFLLVAAAWRAVGLSSAALVGVLAGAAFRRATPGDGFARRVAFVAGLLLLLIGGAAAYCLPGHWMSVYFSLGGQVRTATAEEGDRYLVIAGLALGCLAGALVAGLVARSRALGWLSGIALALALVAAFVFQVPEGRFVPERSDPVPYDTDYVPCYGGDHCPGG